MQFTDHDTDIVKGQLIEDQFERYYFCSPTTGPMFNTYARLRDGLPPYKLGVPGPVDRRRSQAIPTSRRSYSITGGAAPVRDARLRLHLGQRVTARRVAPALPVTGAGNANAVWTIGNIEDPPAEFAGYPDLRQEVPLPHDHRRQRRRRRIYRVGEVADRHDDLRRRRRGDDRRDPGRQPAAGVDELGSRRRPRSRAGSPCRTAS